MELTAPRAAQSLVVDPWFDWGYDRPPDTPWSQTVLYETHVKGISQRHPGVDPALRGTYLGLASPAVLDHLLGLGVTAVELLPVHQSLTEQRLLDLGLTNYWGYSTLGFFAPHAGYRSGHGRGQPGRPVQGDGQDPAPGRAGGDPGRRLQPHRRGRGR